MSNRFSVPLRLLATAALSLVLASLAGAAQRPLPLSFVPNQGQADPSVRFHVRGTGGHVFFTETEVVFSLPSTVLRLRFVGGRPDGLTPGDLLPGRFNSFTGSDPAHWRAGLPTYDGVVYERLYPGVDLAYGGREGSLKGTYTLDPGVDPEILRWRYDGASGLRLDEATGDLHVLLADGASVVEKAPVAWQDVDGRRRDVEARFVLLDSTTAGFRLGSYDATVPLVVDPTLVYSTYFGGTASDQAEDVVVETADAVYLTGRTFSASFPLVNAFQTSNINGEAFVLKIDPEANVVHYSTFLGGSGTDFATDVAVDGGEAYVTGATDSSDFPVTGELQSSHNGGVFDAFVVKLDPNGGLAYGSYLGGSDWDIGSGIALDPPSREILVTGHTDSVDFPVVNALQATKAGLSDFFVTRLDASGGAFVFSTYFGGSGGETNPDIAVDGAGNLLLGGSTDSVDLPLLNAVQPAFAGGFSDAVAVKLDAGGAPLYSTYLGGSGYDYGLDVATYHDHVFFTGTTASADFPVVGQPVQGGLRGLEDAFVVRLDPWGAPVYGTYLGGGAEEGGLGIAVDDFGNAYVTGGTSSSDFPLANPLQATRTGYNNAFVTVLDAAGRNLLFSSYLGGSQYDWGTAIALGANDLAYVAGYTGSADFPVVFPWQYNYQGNEDTFLSVLDTEAARCRF